MGLMRPVTERPAETHHSVYPLLWNYAPNTTTWIFYVALSPWDQMNVAMKNGLPRILTAVDADVETRHRLVQRFDLSFYVSKQ